MIPQRFAQANIEMVAPAGMANCRDVIAHRGQDENGSVVTVTAWRPTAEELVKINLGEPIWLMVWGGLPPVLLTVDDPFETKEPDGTEA